VCFYEENSTNCAALGIHLRHTGIESHNSLGTGERFHGPLQRVMGKLKHDHPRIPDSVGLSMAVHALNITAGPKGLVPILLVFGKLPRLPHVDSVPLNQADRFKAMHVARAEYEQILAQRRIGMALANRPPPSSNYVFEPGQWVNVFRESSRLFAGPHLLADVEGKVLRETRTRVPNLTSITLCI
jgi:hypothetical protein